MSHVADGSANSMAQTTAPPSAESLPTIAAQTLHCEHAIEELRQPPATYTPVLGVVALAAERPLQVNKKDGKLFAKSGLLVRSGAAFTLQVPNGSPLRIAWGHGGQPDRSLQVAGCQGSQKWLAFAGGFWVEQPMCAELVVRQRNREALVRIGVGVACPADP